MLVVHRTCTNKLVTQGDFWSLFLVRTMVPRQRTWVGYFIWTISTRLACSINCIVIAFQFPFTTLNFRQETVKASTNNLVIQTKHMPRLINRNPRRWHDSLIQPRTLDVVSRKEGFYLREMSIVGLSQWGAINDFHLIDEEIHKKYDQRKPVGKDAIYNWKERNLKSIAH